MLKKIMRAAYERVRKELAPVNKHFEETILLLEDEMYRQTKQLDVFSALVNVLSNVLEHTYRIGSMK